MKRTYTQQPDGTLTIKDDAEAVNATGQPMFRQWDIHPSDVDKIIPASAKAGEQFADIKPGDRTAARDAVAEYKDRVREVQRNL